MNSIKAVGPQVEVEKEEGNGSWAESPREGASLWEQDSPAAIFHHMQAWGGYLHRKPRDSLIHPSIHSFTYSSDDH